VLSNRTAAVFDRCLTFGHRFAQRGWPISCVLCGAGARPGVSRFCEPCEASLPRLDDERCEICALPLTSGRVCGACLADPPAYDAVCVPYAYAFPIDALIHAYKYGGDLSLAPVLARVLLMSVRTSVRTHPDVLIPMPLARARLRERGFNQAHEIARHLGRALRIAVVSNALRKVSETPPQAALPWKARARNVRGAFVCDADLTGRHVAIVDDVMTTGATLNEVARSLKRAGAVRVSGWVVARTLRD